MGGIIPEDDAIVLKDRGISAVYTPKDIDLNKIMLDMIDIIRTRNGLNAFGALQ
jgi:(2R)-ethylmalonyl-CoA mutase